MSGDVAAPVGPQAPDASRLRAAIERRLRSEEDIPPDVSLELVGLHPAPVPGLFTGDVLMRRGQRTARRPFVVSADGRYLMTTGIVDLETDPAAEIRAKLDLGSDYPMLGNANSRSAVVVFGDDLCPYTAAAAPTLDRLRERYGSKVKVVYKPFPVEAAHPGATEVALLGLCTWRDAGADAWQDLVTSVRDKRAQVLESSTGDRLALLRAAARDAGASDSSLDACLRDGSPERLALAASIAEAQALGVDSTPTFFADGHRLEGIHPFDAFEVRIAGEGDAVPQP